MNLASDMGGREWENEYRGLLFVLVDLWSHKAFLLMPLIAIIVKVLPAIS